MTLFLLEQQNDGIIFNSDVKIEKDLWEAVTIRCGSQGLSPEALQCLEITNGANQQRRLRSGH